MTQSVDNSEWVMQGVIRDPISGALMRVNADGSINVSIAGGAGAGTGFTSASTAGTALAGTLGTNGLSLGVPAWLTAAAGGGAGTGFTSTTTAGTAVVGTLNSNGLSLGVPAYLTTARGSTDAIGLNTAGTNITWTANSSGLSINAAGYAGTGTTFTNVTATLNSVGLQLNAGGYAGTTTAVTGNASITLNSGGLQFNGSGLAGTNTGASGNLSITANSSGISISQPAIVTISNFVPVNFYNTTTLFALGGTSLSLAVSFELPQYGSFSFIRMPVVNGTTQVTNYTSANTMSSGGAFLYSTWNAVVYSVGSGANSQSLQYYTSGSGGQTQLNSYSFSSANSAWSVTQVYTYLANGFSTATQSTQYSQTTASLNWSTGFLTNLSSARFLDIPFAVSMMPGNYWLVFGMSSSTTTSGQVNAASVTNAAIATFSGVYGMPQVNLPVTPMGDTAFSLGGRWGVGSFSTGGGGTTNSILLSNITAAGNSAPRVYFEMLRSA